TEKALKYVQKAVSLSELATEGERLFAAGMQDLFNGNSVKGMEKFEKIVTLYPNDKQAYFWLSVILSNLQNYPKAVEVLEKAIAIDPNYTAAYNQLGYLCSNMGKYEDAEKALKKYVELLPGESNPYDSYAEVLMKEGKYQESVENYRKAISLKPDFYYSYTGLVGDLLFMGKPEEAMKEARKLFDTADKDAYRQQALYLISTIQIDGGRYNEALETMKKSLAISEKNQDVFGIAQIHNQMGTVLLEKLRQPAEAKTEFIKSFETLDKAPVSEEIKDNARQTFTFVMVRVALKQGDIQTAKKKIEEYKIKAEARRNPNEIRGYHALLGEIALEEKKWDAAISELGQADVSSPWISLWLAKAYSGKGDAAKAKELWKKAAYYNSLNNNFILMRQEVMKKTAELK
ncbi:MAG TPA: tetratricopeptide repeat protein, partial [bacterium]